MFYSYLIKFIILISKISVIIVPNLVWAPGKVADACRTAAASCLCTLAQNSTKVCSISHHVSEQIIKIRFDLKMLDIIDDDIQ